MEIDDKIKSLTNYTSIDNALNSCLSKSSINFIEVGFYLTNLKKNIDLNAYGYADIFDYANERFSIGQRSVYSYMQVAERFADFSNSYFMVKKEYSGYSFTQLCELLTVEDADLNKYDPSMKVSDIRRVKFETNIKHSLQDYLGQVYAPGLTATSANPEVYLINLLNSLSCENYGNFKIVSSRDFSRNSIYDSYVKKYICCYSNFKKALFNLNFEYNNRSSEFRIYLDYKSCGRYDDPYDVDSVSLKIKHGLPIYVAFSENDELVAKFVKNYLEAFQKVQEKNKSDIVAKKLESERIEAEQSMVKSYVCKGYIRHNLIMGDYFKFPKSLRSVIDEAVNKKLLLDNTMVHILSNSAISIMINDFVCYEMSLYSHKFKYIGTYDLLPNDLFDSAEYIYMTANFLTNSLLSYLENNSGEDELNEENI